MGHLQRDPNAADRWSGRTRRFAEDWSRESAGSHGSASQTGWRVPAGGHVGHLSVAERGVDRDIALDGVRVGTVPRAYVDEPWKEFEFVRDGHAIVVAEVIGLHPFASTGDKKSTAEVFVDGINLRDHKTLEEWREKSGWPLDHYDVAAGRGPRGLGRHAGWRGFLIRVNPARLLTGRRHTQTAKPDQPNDLSRPRR